MQLPALPHQLFDSPCHAAAPLKQPRPATLAWMHVGKGTPGADMHKSGGSRSRGCARRGGGCSGSRAHRSGGRPAAALGARCTRRVCRRWEGIQVLDRPMRHAHRFKLRAKPSLVYARIGLVSAGAGVAGVVPPPPSPFVQQSMRGGVTRRGAKALAVASLQPSTPARLLQPTQPQWPPLSLHAFAEDGDMTGYESDDGGPAQAAQGPEHAYVQVR